MTPFTAAALRPEVAFVTVDGGVGCFPRMARALGRSFAQLGVPFDAVYLAGPERVVSSGAARAVHLGDVRARSSVPALVRYLRAARPRVTIVAPGHVTPFVLAAGRVAGETVVPWEQTFLPADTRDMPLTGRLLPLLHRPTYRWAGAVAAVSEDVRAHLSRRHGIDDAQLFCVPNPIDVAEVRRLAEPAERGERPRFVSVGRLVHQKGVDVLLRAFARARPELAEDWELVVVGDGPRRRELERLADGLGLAGAVVFAGSLENPYPLMAGADVFVHTARWEGFGVVLTEALALGLPVVGSACPGGPREILGDGAGVLVAPDDPEALAGELVRLARDPGLRSALGARGRVRVERYTADRVARRLLQLVEQVAA